MSKNLSLCRNCNHMKLAHSTYKDGVKISNQCNLWKDDIRGKECHCFTFVPLDNLEYLEYQYNKRNNNKRFFDFINL